MRRAAGDAAGWIGMKHFANGKKQIQAMIHQIVARFVAPQVHPADLTFSGGRA